jgi:hypothetical protein
MNKDGGETLVPGSTEGMAQAFLMSKDPEMQEKGLGLFMQSRQAKTDAEEAERVYQRGRTDSFEDAEDTHERSLEIQKAKVANRPLVPGRDVPLPSGVQAQKVQVAGAKAQAQAAARPPTATLEKRYFDGRDKIASGTDAIAALNEAMALSATAFEGGFADERATIAKNTPDALIPADVKQAAINTGLMDKKIGGQALQQLKVIFGGMTP